MTWVIPDYMARVGLFQRSLVTAETDKLRIARFCLLLRGILVLYSPVTISCCNEGDSLLAKLQQHLQQQKQRLLLLLLLLLLAACCCYYYNVYYNYYVYYKVYTAEVSAL